MVLEHFIEKRETSEKKLNFFWHGRAIRIPTTDQNWQYFNRLDFHLSQFVDLEPYGKNKVNGYREKLVWNQSFEKHFWPGFAFPMFQDSGSERRYKKLSIESSLHV